MGKKKKLQVVDPDKYNLVKKRIIGKVSSDQTPEERAYNEVKMGMGKTMAETIEIDLNQEEEYAGEIIELNKNYIIEKTGIEHLSIVWPEFLPIKAKLEIQGNTSVSKYALDTLYYSHELREAIAKNDVELAVWLTMRFMHCGNLMHFKASGLEKTAWRGATNKGRKGGAADNDDPEIVRLVDTLLLYFATGGKRLLKGNTCNAVDECFKELVVALFNLESLPDSSLKSHLFNQNFQTPVLQTAFRNQPRNKFGIDKIKSRFDILFTN